MTLWVTNNARKIQFERYKKYGIHSNAELSTKMIAEFCRLDNRGEELLQSAFRKLKLSVRAYERILKVARTIADLEGKENIEFKHYNNRFGAGRTCEIYFSNNKKIIYGTREDDITEYLELI